MWFQNESDESTPNTVQATKKRPDGATCVFLTTWGQPTPMPNPSSNDMTTIAAARISQEMFHPTAAKVVLVGASP